jgi:hypothetical protein
MLFQINNVESATVFKGRKMKEMKELKRKEKGKNKFKEMKRNE